MCLAPKNVKLLQLERSWCGRGQEYGAREAKRGRALSRDSQFSFRTAEKERPELGVLHMTVGDSEPLAGVSKDAAHKMRPCHFTHAFDLVITPAHAYHEEFPLDG